MSMVVDKIKEIVFGVLSPEKIRKLSVVEVTTPDTYDESGLPLPNGLMDPRMGSLEPGQICPTCKNTAVRCPGHFGHIELAEPIIHIGFVKVIKRILDSFCPNCGRIALPEEEVKSLLKSLERKGVSRFYRQKLIKMAYVKARAATKCPHCGAVKNKIEFQKPYIFNEITPEGGIRRLTAAMIKERFERLHVDDLPLLGINPERAHPKWYILEVLPVPPLTVRPSIILETGLRSEDDLTHKLVDIVMINQRIKENKESGAPSLLIYDLVDLLQYHITTFFDNRIPGIPQAKHRGGRPLRTISQRLSGKEGRFRLNLSGKRVNFSARSVISPDSNLELNEVGVPLEIAMKLTVPMRVTPWNLELAKKLVKNGPFVHPGANYVIRPDGKRIRLDFVPDREALAEALQPGFIVERHIMDGDVALFNRQPSLHRMSMMAHYVRVLPGKTLRLHLSVCPPYNADFDGDEMNLHIVRSEEAIAEAKTLMAVEGQIISPRYGAPLIGGVRDHISGLYLLTRKDTLLTAEEACALLYAIDYKGPLPEPVAYKGGKPLYSGKSIFSLIIPKGFTYSLKASICRNCAKCKYENCEYDAYVVVRNGILEKGVIDKASIGAEKTDSILHRIVREYGPEVGREFATKAVKLSDTFLRMRGLSMGYSDLKVPRGAMRDIAKILNKASKAVDKYVEKYLKGELEPLKGYSLEESLELRIMDELSRARDKAGELVLQRMEEDNSLVVMVSSGARGSLLNISQLAASVGQQSIRGKRIHRGYKDRTLTFFKPNDLGALARGFVFSCFRDGLNPIEFFFHAMGGREGIVDTAVRTQQSGYLQRRLINALTDLRVEYDLSVRTSGGRIVQFIYGEDGVDPGKSDHGKAVNVERLVASIKLLHEGEPPAPLKVVRKILSKIRDEIPPKLFEEVKSALEKHKLSESAVKEVVNRVVKSYKKSLIEPGLAVGVIAAQSIGEPGTQMTLRTFHFAGVRERNVTLGLPRIIEIVDARKEPTTPSMVIYLKDGRNKSRAEVERLAKRIVATRLKDLTIETTVDLLSQSVVFLLDEGELAVRSITAEDVASKLRRSKALSVQVVGPKVIVRAAGYDYSKLLKLRDKLLEKHISGIPGIEGITVALEGGEWVLYTVGSNLKTVLELPEVDETRTKTNDIMQIASVLGIEAARNAIVEEIMSVLNEQGLDVDVRHVMLVADVMTLNGEVRQIGRYGVVAQKESVLARAAYETTVQTLLSAAVAGEVDNLRDVVSSIIVGQTAPIGTGFIDLLMEIGGKGGSGSSQTPAG